VEKKRARLQGGAAWAANMPAVPSAGPFHPHYLLSPGLAAVPWEKSGKPFTGKIVHHEEVSRLRLLEVRLPALVLHFQLWLCTLSPAPVLHWFLSGTALHTVGSSCRQLEGCCLLHATWHVVAA
jgi:hypothetical protein